MDTNNMSKKNSLVVIISIVLLAGVLFLGATIFMPYVTATKDYKSRVAPYENVVIYGEVNMTYGDLMNVSLFDFARIYYEHGDEMWSDPSFRMVYVGFVVVLGALALVSALFAFFRKPIAVMVINLLSMGVFMLQRWDYMDRGVVPSDNYNWGIGYYIYYLIWIIVFVIAVILLVAKIKEKREMRKSTS